MSWNIVLTLFDVKRLVPDMRKRVLLMSSEFGINHYRKQFTLIKKDKELGRVLSCCWTL
jgi:hypothetical protein